MNKQQAEQVKSGDRVLYQGRTWVVVGVARHFAPEMPIAHFVLASEPGAISLGYPHDSKSVSYRSVRAVTK